MIATGPGQGDYLENGLEDDALSPTNQSAASS